MDRLRTSLKRQLQSFKTQGDYWRSLPDRALVKLLLAVFFMFSTTGIVGHIQMIASSGKTHWLLALLQALLAGANAAAFVFAFIRARRYLLLIVPAQIGGSGCPRRGRGTRSCARWTRARSPPSSLCTEPSAPSRSWSGTSSSSTSSSVRA